MANQSNSSHFSFTPPPGGDFPIKSSDGVTFVVHSALLIIASPVFADMFSTANRGDGVTLTEDSESIAVMLRYIYPPALLRTNSFRVLGKGLHMARKYELEGVTSAIDYFISHSIDSDGFMSTDPARAYALAVEYVLPETRQTAHIFMQSHYYDFGTLDGVKHLVDVFPDSAAAIGLMGAHSIRSKALFDLLVNLNSVTLEVDDDPDSRLLMCQPCFSELPVQPGDYECVRLKDDLCRPPWLYAWGIMAYNHLTSKPLEECEHVFQASSLDQLGQLGQQTCPDCLKIARNTNAGSFFEDWVKGAVRVHVEKIFQDISAL